ncbi:guanine nucleotide exchange factor [Chlamydoabsidia padenii]|nr:guanine nucleotide exchange factor [Chlamydoabsidia padenii]
MSFTTHYLDVRDNPSQLIPFLSQLQQDLHELTSNEVRSLTSYLLADLDVQAHEKEWDEQVMAHILLTLKYFGRRIDDCDMLYKKQGFHILMKWTGLLEESRLVDTNVTQEALKCLANCILLSGDTMKPWLIESKNALMTCARLLHSDSVSVDIQFLICRLLYLMIYGQDPCIVDILMDLDLPDALAKILSRHVQAWLQDPTTYTSPTQSQPTMLVCEVFKLQKNLMINLQESKSTTSSITTDDSDTDSTMLSIKEEVAERFTSSLIPILDIFYFLPYPMPLPLLPAHPFTDTLFILNLYTYDLVRDGWYRSPRLAPLCEDKEYAFGFCVKFLIDVLEKTLIYLMPPVSSTTTVAPSSNNILPWETCRPPHQNDDDNLDRAMALILSYLISMMVVVEDIAPSLKHKIVPVSLDPTVPDDGKHDNDNDDTLLFFSRLVKLFSSKRFPQAKEMVGELLYSHVGEDANAFITLVGYDNAKQTLMTKDYCPDDTYTSNISPATNVSDQFIQLSDMTDEEKEREAERLFVMFEKVQLQD